MFDSTIIDRPCTFLLVTTHHQFTKSLHRARARCHRCSGLLSLKVTNGVRFNAKIPLHDVDTGHGRRFGARQLWRARSASDESTATKPADYRLEMPGHILASAALVTSRSQRSSYLSATRQEAMK
jgi:hypothetical protein